MTDTSQWHPLIKEAYEDPHYLVHPAGEWGCSAAQLNAYRYNSAVTSLCFKWWEDGLAPFYADAVIALNELEVPNFQGNAWTTRHLNRVVRTRYLHGELVKLRHGGNLAYVDRMADRGRRSIYRHHAPA